MGEPHRQPRHGVVRGGAGDSYKTCAKRNGPPVRSRCGRRQEASPALRWCARPRAACGVPPVFQAFSRRLDTFRERIRKRSGKHRAAARKVAGRAPKPKPDRVNDGAFLPDRTAAGAGFNRSIPDAGWGPFLRILANEAERAGSLVIPVDARDRAGPALCDADRPAAWEARASTRGWSHAQVLALSRTQAVHRILPGTAVGSSWVVQEVLVHISCRPGLVPGADRYSPLPASGARSNARFDMGLFRVETSRK